MSKRSLKLSPEGVRKARRQFASKGWTQEYIALEVGIKTRQPIWKFFAGEAIERFTFFEVCKLLDLDWQEVSQNPPAEIIDRTADETELKPQLASISLDALVEQVRSLRQEKIDHQCGILQLLDIGYPASIEHLYVEVNVLEQISSQQLEVSALDSSHPKDIDRFSLGTLHESQISGMQAVEKYCKLRVLGKPGSGKTIFLKHLAMQCNQQKFAPTQVPIFLTLRDFAETYQAKPQITLLKFIHQEFITSGISELAVIEKLLLGGRVLLLIDGLDEVSGNDENLIISEVRRFCETYYKNQFVFSCRTAPPKLSCKGFTDVEIAPFAKIQIETFIQKWFGEFRRNNAPEDQIEEFLKKLSLPENWSFRRLMTTPLFLHLACSMFHYQDNSSLKKVEFYKQGIDLLLGEWDEIRGIKRGQEYEGFALLQKLKLISQIACTTFEQKQYFFAEDVLEQHVNTYIKTMPNVSQEPEEISQLSKFVLRAIESQHGVLAERRKGIFSFSYLALQEYFTARKIVINHNFQPLGESLQGLVSHITDPHWREIFLLTSIMLHQADGLMQLMEQEIDRMMSEDPHLQDFLVWTKQKASQKSLDISRENTPATERIFYLALTRTPHLAGSFAIACTLDQEIFVDAVLEELLQEFFLNKSKDFAHIHACGDALSNILGLVVDLGFQRSLQELSEQLSDDDLIRDSFEKWCIDNYANWKKQFQNTIALHQDMGNQWNFDVHQKQVLQNYYDANQLLLDCLGSNDCKVTASTRAEIETRLSIPQK